MLVFSSLLLRIFGLSCALACGVLLVLSAPNVAQADIQLVGTSTAVGTNAAYNVSLTALQGGIGSAAATNDLVVVANVIAGGDNTDRNPGVGTAGYTEMADLFSNDTQEANLSVNYKVMGSVPDTTVSCNASALSTNSSVCYVMVWRGVSTSSPMDTASTTATGINGEDVDCPSITPLRSGAIVVCTGGAAGASIDAFSTTTPTGYTVLVDKGSDPGLAGAGVAAYKAWTSGSEDPSAYSFDLGTASANAWAALTMALQPALYVTTSAASNVAAISAALNGSIGTTTGAVSTRGFAWGTNSTLSGGDTSTTTDSGAYSPGSFTQAVSNIRAGETYYFRAYATNASGTSYGTITNFTAGTDTSTARTLRLFEGFRLKIIEGNRLQLLPR